MVWEEGDGAGGRGLKVSASQVPDAGEMSGWDTFDAVGGGSGRWLRLPGAKRGATFAAECEGRHFPSMDFRRRQPAHPKPSSPRSRPGWIYFCSSYCCLGLAITYRDCLFVSLTLRFWRLLPRGSGWKMEGRRAQVTHLFTPFPS